ncbi:MAG: ABC transporter ATP-binding protein [Tenericutes bacterium]|jgi:ATP-binding cassette subfamily B multidrug efflux pump|nr:ABC transporter ATP-binding protein [Mycoplasmatota bacterium]
MTDKKREKDKNQNSGPGHGMPLGRPAEKAKDFKGTTKRLLDYIGKYKWQLLLISIFTIIVSGVAVVGPNFIRFILNDMQRMVNGEISNDEGTQNIMRYFIIVIILYVIRFIFEVIMMLIGNKVSINIGKKMRNDLREKLEKLPIKYFDEKQTGDVLSVFSNDVDIVTNSIQQSLINIISSTFIVIGILVMMFIISWKLTIIALLALPLFILATATIAKKSQKKFKAQQKELGVLNGHIEEMFTASKIVKLFNKQEESYQDFSKINHSLAGQMKGAQFLSGLIRPIMEFISNIGYVMVVIVGGYMAGLPSPLLIGDITVFVQYQRSFVNPILNIANIVNQLQSTIAGAERIFKVLDEEEELNEVEEAGFKELSAKGHVVFDDVDFSYKEDTELIQNLNLEVDPGRQIAIVGHTGAGKTTLVNLLMRFYDIDKGSILVDGMKTTEIPRVLLRKQFGMVLQDTWLFSGTIRDNIAYGKADATDEEIIEACKKAHVHHYIETLPEGYDTVLKEDADNISQGQKQLLTIARAILFDPKILILDEATSSVDTRTESYIQNAMLKMMEGKTSFVIAHRLSTIKNANLILVMDHGKIVEQGDHQSLLNQNGVYADLYNSQFLNKPI